MTRLDLVELARICARNAHTATSIDVARELWKMAREYRQKAAGLDSGRLVEIGVPPPGIPLTNSPDQAPASMRATKRR